LKTSFHHSSFKPEQWQVIHAVINEKRDCFLQAPTAYGKSLCYQFPPVYLGKTAIVFVSLRSIAEDQILSLKTSKIKVCIFDKDNMSNLWKFQIIFVLPDSVESAEVLAQLKNQICLVAIDECSLKGADKHLKVLKDTFSDIPILHLSALGTEATRQEISSKLGMENHLIVKANMDRPNIEYSILDNLCLPYVLFGEKEKCDGAIIVYFSHYYIVQDYSSRILFECSHSDYHEGQTEKERQTTVKMFTEGSASIVLATSDFRVNRSDVRVVIQHCLMDDLDEFSLLAGQAGRDGKPAKCILISGNLLSIKDEPIKNFILSKECRRKILLRRTESPVDNLLVRENCCDNCLKTLHSRVPLHKMYKIVDKSNRADISDDVRMILQLVFLCKRRTRFTMKMINFLMGEFPDVTNKIRPLELFGKGKGKPEEWWKILLTKLNDDKIIDSSYPKVMEKGLKFMKRKTMKMYEDPIKIIKFLEKTNEEFYIENGEVKCKSRLMPSEVEESPKIKELVKPTSSSNLFDFEVSKSSRKPKSSKNRPGCSKWSQEESEEQEDNEEKEDSEGASDEDQKQVNNLQWARRALNKPLKVDLDNLMDYFENRRDVCGESSGQAEGLGEGEEQVGDGSGSECSATPSKLRKL
jgi:superfamily II DNA helicase RecQ